MKNQKDLSLLSDGLRRGDRSALARAITLAESIRPADQQAVVDLLAQLVASGKSSTRLALTGPPGAGKSTLIGELGLRLVRKGLRVAVLTIDPSSPVSGGSLLGDKTRMTELARSESAFIRPSPNAGSSGGVSPRTREAVSLCEAAGYDIIIVETVGVGQSEFRVREMVDALLLVLIPGAGDSLQGMKRGILEVADLIAVNKADGDQLPAALQAAHELESSLRLYDPRDDGWPVTIRTCSAVTGAGLDELLEDLFAYCRMMQASGAWERRRTEQRLLWLESETRAQFQRLQPGWGDWLDRSRQAGILIRAGDMNEYEALKHVVG